jgi:hypothetical protein
MHTGRTGWPSEPLQRSLTLASGLDVAPPGSVRMEVELADGRVLTLRHDRGAWYHRRS